MCDSRCHDLVAGVCLSIAMQCRGSESDSSRTRTKCAILLAVRVELEKQIQTTVARQDRRQGSGVGALGVSARF